MSASERNGVLNIFLFFVCFIAEIDRWITFLSLAGSSLLTELIVLSTESAKGQQESYRSRVGRLRGVTARLKSNRNSRESQVGCKSMVGISSGCAQN